MSFTRSRTTINYTYMINDSIIGVVISKKELVIRYSF